MTGIIIKTFLTISSIREYRRRKNSCDLMRVCADEEEDEKRDFLIYCVLVCTKNTKLCVGFEE
jgi:hypothetical protein